MDKYEEALQKAKELYEMHNSFSYNRQLLEEIFPELRESEEETTRKELLDFVRSFWADHKEKLPQASRWVTYLEKLKENPKSTDSIPSDCVSDAKCENRWHKVQDSLPDNGRLVLAQDCLGNTLLARYDGEGNWEVSVYDNEDYYCRNTITKWCEIPSEKQKEQRPKNILTDDDSLQTAYLKGQTDVLEDPEAYGLQKEQKPVECVADSIKFDEGFKTGREVGFREGVESVKPAEWSEEDKTMVNHIIEALPKWANGLITILPSQAEEYVKRLKSLRPSWKPSDEQMIALYNMIPFVKSKCAPLEAVKPLESLYEDLKKL